MLDEILNAVLFLIIGLEVFTLSYEHSAIMVALACIPLVVAARFVTLGTIFTALRLKRTFSPGALPIMVWGGLRGGISAGALPAAVPAQGPAADGDLRGGDLFHRGAGPDHQAAGRTLAEEGDELTAQPDAATFSW